MSDLQLDALDFLIDRTIPFRAGSKSRIAERQTRAVDIIKSAISQRDELLAAAKAAYEVLIQERDHIPMTLRIVMPNGAIKRLRAAIANAERPSGC